MNLALVGVGGQGIMLAGRIIARAAELEGVPVSASEVHGMSQRGGPVFAAVRYGEHDLPPMVPKGDANVLVAFEKLEALRYLDYLHPAGTALVNDQRVAPTIESLKRAAYPSDVEPVLRGRAAGVILVPGPEIAAKLKNPRLTNTVLLGALSTLLDLSKPAWLQAIEELVPGHTIEGNWEAFDKGLAWTRKHVSMSHGIGA